MKPSDQIKQIAIDDISAGWPVVMPTDTIYGLVGSAKQPKVVENIYQLRQREPDKPCIVLIGQLADLAELGLKPTASQMTLLDQIWPGAISVILPCPSLNWHYLHRSQKTLACRLPKTDWLRDILAASGPVIAPSANPAGQPPASNLAQARNYFGSSVKYWPPDDDITVDSQPSTLITLINDQIKILRSGAGDDILHRLDYLSRQ